MSRRLSLGSAVPVALIGVFTIACSGVVDPSKNVVETFTGTVKVQSSDSKPFSTSKSGEYSVKVTSLVPNTGALFAILLAIAPTQGSCVGAQIFSQPNAFATVNVTALSGPIYPGNYCVFISDNGSFTTDETYTLQVSHP